MRQYLILSSIRLHLSVTCYSTLNSLILSFSKHCELVVASYLKTVSVGNLHVEYSFITHSILFKEKEGITLSCYMYKVTVPNFVILLGITISSTVKGQCAYPMDEPSCISYLSTRLYEPRNTVPC